MDFSPPLRRTLSTPSAFYPHHSADSGLDEVLEYDHIFHSSQVGGLANFGVGAGSSSSLGPVSIGSGGHLMDSHTVTPHMLNLEDHQMAEAHHLSRSFSMPYHALQQAANEAMSLGMSPTDFLHDNGGHEDHHDPFEFDTIDHSVGHNEHKEHQQQHHDDQDYHEDHHESQHMDMSNGGSPATPYHSHQLKRSISYCTPMQTLNYGLITPASVHSPEYKFNHQRNSSISRSFSHSGSDSHHQFMTPMTPSSSVPTTSNSKSFTGVVSTKLEFPPSPGSSSPQLTTSTGVNPFYSPVSYGKPKTMKGMRQLKTKAKSETRSMSGLPLSPPIGMSEQAPDEASMAAAAAAAAAEAASADQLTGTISANFSTKIKTDFGASHHYKRRSESSDTINELHVTKRHHSVSHDHHHQSSFQLMAAAMVNTMTVQPPKKEDFQSDSKVSEFDEEDEDEDDLEDDDEDGPSLGLGTKRGKPQSRAHICSTCHKAFRRNEHLKRHFKVHTAERPYVCDVSGCERRFSRNDNLRAHRRTHLKRNGRNVYVPNMDV